MRALVQELDETIEQVSTRTGELRGRLRVTAPMTFGTRYRGPVLAAFERDHLALDLDDRVLDLVANNVAIRIGHLQDSSLIARKFCLSRRVVCCSPGYAQARGLPTSIEGLGAHECIDYANVHSKTALAIRTIDARRKAPLTTRLSRPVDGKSAPSAYSGRKHGRSVWSEPCSGRAEAGL